MILKHPYYNKLFTFQLFLLAATLPFVQQHPLPVLFFGLVLLLFPWFFLSLKDVAHKTIKISLVFFSLALVLNSYGTLKGLEPGLSLLLLVTLLKSSELATKRDQFIFLLMTVLSLVGHLLNVDQLIYVLYILLMALWMIRLFFSSEGYDERRSQSFRWSTKKSKDLFFIFAIAIPQAVLLFFFFPRFYVGNLSFSGSSPISKVGFIDELNPGDWSKTVEDRTPIFRASFQDGKPSRGGLYWRGAVLQKSLGFRWVVGDVPDDLERWGFFIGRGDIDRRYRVDFDSSFEHRLFTLPFTIRMDLKSHGRVLNTPGSLYQVHSSQSQAPRYEAATSPPWGAFDLSEQEREQYLQVPEVSNRLQRFATDFKSRFSSDQELIQGLLAYYHEQPFVYTLDPGSYLSRYPEDEFFFQRRRGFCEHYASFTGLLLRLWGIPARVVTGFQGGVYNPVGDYFVLRGEDAHAWVEAFTPEEGWTLVDPIRAIAPWRIEYGAEAFFLQLNGLDDPLNSDFEMNPSLWKRTLFTIDSYYYRANLFFTNYREDAQRSFLDYLGLSEFSPVRLLVFVGGIFFAFYLFSLFIYLPKRLPDPAYEMDFKLLKQSLLKAGFEKAPYQSAGHFHRLTEKHLPEHLRDDFSRLVHRYEILKYSSQTTSKSLERDFKKSIQLFIGELTRRG
jgi:protein-glutamine gamma-glutamyltransferase